MNNFGVVHKREDNIKTYEKINRINLFEIGKGSNYLYELNFGKYKGFYSIKLIESFEECTINRRTLSQRFQKITAKIGNFYSLEEAICSPAVPRVKLEKEAKESKLLSKDEEEMKWFNESIKLMKPGSLAGEVR